MLAKRICDAPEIYLIEVPFKNICTHATNCYLLRSGDDSLLVDTGAWSEEGAEVLLSAIDEIGIDRSRMQCFLTHLHLDHAGLVDQAVLPDQPVFLSLKDYDATCRPQTTSSFASMRDKFLHDGVLTADASAFARFSLEPQPFDPDAHEIRYVEDDDTITVGDCHLRVVATPGHTCGHLSLFEPQSGILFGGDHILYVMSPGIGLSLDDDNAMRLYLASLQKVRDLGMQRLLVAHGPERDDFIERIDWLRAHHEERLKEAYDIVCKQPGITASAAIKKIKWNVPFQNWEDISLIQRWCIMVEGGTIMDYLLETGHVRKELAYGHDEYFPI